MNGLTYPLRLQNAKSEAILQGYIFEAADGIMEGCALTNTNTSITVGIGHFAAAYRRQYLESAETTNLTGIPSSGYARLKFVIGLSATPSKDTFTQGDWEVDYSATIAGFSALTQQDINAVGTNDTYEIEFAIYSITSSVLDSLIRSIQSLLPVGGWRPACEIWEYSSVDDPIGIITIAGDVHEKYTASTRIQFTNGGNTINGIVVEDASYSSPSTTVKFLHEINTTTRQALHLMADSIITNPYYSYMKSPAKFPANPDKWTVEVSSTSDCQKSSPVTSTWYGGAGLTSTGPSITIPIGIWDVSYQASLFTTPESAANNAGRITLSTANNSESDADFTSKQLAYNLSAPGRLQTEHARQKTLALTSKTEYYLNIVSDVSLSVISISGSTSKTIIRARCALL